MRQRIGPKLKRPKRTEQFLLPRQHAEALSEPQRSA
jgi:hypothetical protein